MHQQFSGSGKLLGQWLFWFFKFFSKDSAKNGPKVKNGTRKIKNDDTKTGITQVLTELQQKFFHQHWAQKWTKTVNFGHVPFLLKHKIFFKIVQTLSCLTRDKMSTKLGHIWERKGPETPQKEPFHGCCITTKTFENL